MTDVLQLAPGANESDIAGALALLKNGGTLILPANETIRITDGLKIDVTSRDITINLNGSTLQQAGDASVITGFGTMSAGQAVSLDISGENAKVTFSGSTSGLKVGDWIKIVADEVLPFDNRNTTEPTRLGQAMQIVSINGNTVEVKGEPLYADQYLTNVRAGEIVSGKLTITNGTVVGDQTQPSWNADLIAIRNAIAPEVNHLTVRDGNSMGINFVNTVNALAQDNAIINLLDDIPLGHYGYAVHSASSIGTTVIGLYAERVRHATDDNGVVSDVNDPNLAHYGADINLHVKDTVSYYASAFSYSFHSEGRNALLENVMSFESNGFVGFRGVGNQVINSGSVGDQRGFQYMEYGYGDSSYEVADNVIIREAGRYVYVVTGNPTNNVIKNSYLEYETRDGNLGTTQLVNTTVTRWSGVDDDILVGTDQGDRLLGGRGVDTINGGGGADYIWGGAGADRLTGGAGSDRFVFDRTDSVDIITDFQAGSGGDYLDVAILGARYGWTGDFLAKGYVHFTQDGSDTLVEVAPALGGTYYQIARLQNVSASTLTADNLQMSLSGGASPSALPVPTATVPTGSVGYAKGVKIVGTTGVDFVDATHSPSGQPLPTINADSISTNAGDDYIDGLGGADTINAGAGNDTVVYYGGVQSNLQGGSGRDVLLLLSSDIIDLSASDQSEGLPVVSGFDDVDGRLTSAPLHITGNSSNNNLWGGSGDDVIKGGDGNDTIDGGQGDDLIIYDGNREDYSFIRINATTWRVQDLRGSLPYRDYVSNVERVSFDDATFFIDDLNRQPTDIILSAATVAENAPAGTLVGVLTGIDPDVSEINTWTLLDDAQGRFSLVANQIFTTAPLDFENGQSYTVSIQLTDSDGHILVKDFVLGVRDVNDNAPTWTSPSSAAVNENTQFVQRLSAADVDTTGEALTMAIDPTVADGALFEIVNGNELQFKSAPDFESSTHNPLYQVQIIVSDGVNSSTQLLTVEVKNVTISDTAFGTSSDDSVVYDDGQGIFTYNGAQSPISTLGYDTLKLLEGNNRFEFRATSVAITGDVNGLVHFDSRGDAVPEFSIGDAQQIQVTASAVRFDSPIVNTSISSLKLVGTSAIDTLDGSGAGIALSLQGLSGNDVLVGGSGADILDGGSGDDRMTGNGGDDLYIVDSAGDVVVEQVGGGIDTVQTSLTSYTLSANVENLTYVGTKSFSGVGNALDNVLVGSSAADRLDGGAGADTMRGGAGSDTYVVDNVKDVIFELFNEGTDRVLSQVSYTLSDNVENLTLTTSLALSGTGNALANVIIGNAGANVLDGRGGADTLTGGAGNDTFVFQRGEAAGDVITDFAGAGVVGGDVLRFVGFGQDAYLTHAAGSDMYEIHAGAAYGGVVETIQLTGVTNLASGDYIFI